MLLTRCDTSLNTPLHHVLYALLDLQVTAGPVEESFAFVHEFLDTITDDLVPTLSMDSVNCNGDSCLMLLLRSMASPNFPISACRGLVILVSAAANPILACLHVGALLKDRAQSEWRLIAEWRAHADHFASVVATLLASRRGAEDQSYTYPDSYLLERGVDGRNAIEIAVDHEIYSVLGAPRFQDLVNAIWLDSQAVRKYGSSGGLTKMAGVGAVRGRRTTMVPTVRGSFITASESQLEMADLGNSPRPTLGDVEAPPPPSPVRKLGSGGSGANLPSPSQPAPDSGEVMLQEKATLFLGIRPSPRNKFFLEIASFLFFVGVLCTFVMYEGGITRRTYLLTNHYEDVFVKEPFSGVTQKAYLDISTQRDLWQWMNNVLLRGISQNSEWTAAETTCSAPVPADDLEYGGASPSNEQCEFGLVAASAPWTAAEKSGHRTYFSPTSGVSLRQLRVQGSECKAKRGIAVVMGPANPAPNICYRSYTASLEAAQWGNDETPALTDAHLSNVARSALSRAWSAASLRPGGAPYNASSTNITEAQVVELAGRLRAATVFRLPTAPVSLEFSGPLFKRYSGAGFVAVLGAKREDFFGNLALLYGLQAIKWLDASTRALIVDLAVANPNSRVATASRFLFEMPASGGVVTSRFLRVIGEFYLAPSSSPVLLAMAFFLFVYYLSFWLTIIVTLWWSFARRHRWRPVLSGHARRLWILLALRDFLGDWRTLNKVVVTSTLTGVIIVRFTISRLVSHFEDVAKRSGDREAEQLNAALFAIGESVMTTKILLGLTCLSAFFEFWRFMSISTWLGPILVVISHSVIGLFGFFAILGVFMAGYLLSLTVLFGDTLKDFASPWATLVTLLRMLFGDFNLAQMYDEAGAISAIGILLIISYILFGSLLLLNVLIGIISSLFNRVQKSSEAEYLRLFARNSLAYRYMQWVPPFNLLLLPLVAYRATSRWLAIRKVMKKTGRRPSFKRPGVTTALHIPAVMAAVRSFQRNNTAAETNVGRGGAPREAARDENITHL